MSASELFKSGNLQPAIDAQIKEVKANPADHARRLFLFEMLAFAGDLDRARRQVDAVNYGQMELDTAVLAYRKLLDAEEKRRRLFRDGLSPQFLREPPEHIRLRLEAVNRLREGRKDEALQTLEKAAAVTPAVQGQLNGKPFNTLRDCDDLLAGVLEVMNQGNYYWLPLEQVDSVAMNPPKFPRDLLWVPARLAVRDGPSGEAYLPALYSGSHEHADNQVKLGRMTDWKGAEGEPILGQGLRMFLVDDDAVSLLDWRDLVVAPEAG
jgi:type VI secretion system protein ImpE